MNFADATFPTPLEWVVIFAQQYWWALLAIVGIGVVVVMLFREEEKGVKK